MSKVLFCVYGTLKKKYGNHRLLHHDGVEFKGEFKTEPKFTMVSCGGFPAVHCEGNTAIDCELYEVTNPDVINNIYRLEGCTGKQGHPNNWYDIEYVDTPHGQASMFVFRGAIRRPIVESGKW